MKAKTIVCLVFAISTLFVGCSNPVKEDLLTYINKDLAKIAGFESEIMAKYASVTGSNYTNDWTIYFVLEEDVLPKYNKFIKQLEAISPKTDDVRKVHEIYIKASNVQYSGMTIIQSALLRGDASQLAQANEKLAEGRALLREFQRSLQELCSKNGVTYPLKQ